MAPVAHSDGVRVEVAGDLLPSYEALTAKALLEPGHQPGWF